MYCAICCGRVSVPQRVDGIPSVVLRHASRSSPTTPQPTPQALFNMSSTKKRSRGVEPPESDVDKHKRLAREHDDVVLRAAWMAWLPTSHVRDALQSAEFPDAFMRRLHTLTRTTTMWMHLPKALIGMYSFHSGKEIVQLLRLSRHWNQALKACPPHPDTRLYIDKVVAQYTPWGVRGNKPYKFWVKHETQLKSARHWIITNDAIKTWLKLCEAEPFKRLASQVDRYQIHYKMVNHRRIASLLKFTPHVHHLHVYPYQPGSVYRVEDIPLRELRSYHSIPRHGLSTPAENADYRRSELSFLTHSRDTLQSISLLACVVQPIMLNELTSDFSLPLRIQLSGTPWPTGLFDILGDRVSFYDKSRGRLVTYTRTLDVMKTHKDVRFRSKNQGEIMDALCIFH